MYRETDGTTAVTTDAEARTAMLAQLTQFTDANGMVSATKDATFKYGPYIKKGTLPANPFNEDNDVVCDFDQNDITLARTADTTTGWKYYVPIGVFFPNDSAANQDL